MKLQTMSNLPRMSEELLVGRGDPVYMAHAYLTKVPVPAITPFIEVYVPSGGTVVDPFAGSGMTGVAAAVLGRRARLFDISVLGQHIGTNYVNHVDADQFRKVAAEVVDRARDTLGDCYQLKCSACDREAQLAKAVWTIDVACKGCGESVNYYDALETADWVKGRMTCPHCDAAISAKLAHQGESRVLDYITCECSAKQLEQAPPVSEHWELDATLASSPHVEITPDRQMYQAQSLGKSGRTTIAAFYSARNLAVLTALRHQIDLVGDEPIRSKLMFAFTASLTRASKRYQWSRQRPLNAANANYYVAPVFYEWNVFDLFLRKVEAAIRSDNYVRSQAAVYGVQDDHWPDVTYEISSADSIPLADASVDYVFTDPPFGSNLFYADMALFQEAWLSGFTDVSLEAVVGRGTKRQDSTERYVRVLAEALGECRRIVKPGGRISMVFGNSSGAVWALVQQAIDAADLAIDPEALVILNKGQRSVKGLASGFEHVATLDLIITMYAVERGSTPPLRRYPPELVTETVRRVTEGTETTTPSHLYLEILRLGMRERLDLGGIHLGAVTNALRDNNWMIDEKTGSLYRAKTRG